MSNQLVPASGTPGTLPLGNLDEVVRLGTILAQSGMFKDCRTAAQAVVKILAGRELGFPPLASLVGVHMIEGKPTIGSHLLAAAIRGSGRYDFAILEHSDDVCAVRFKRKLPDDTWADQHPIERLTLEEAVRKGWTVNRPTWTRTPKNMLFARCLTNGYKFHCPDLFSGLLVYDQDELNEPGPVIDASYSVQHDDGSQTHVSDTETVTTRAPQPAAEASPPNPTTPPQEQGGLTEPEVAHLTSLAREHKRTQGEVTAILKVVGVPVLIRAPRAKLGWLQHALTTGLCPAVQKDRIAATITEQGRDWDRFRLYLERTYGVTSVAHLLPVQADALEARLKEGVKHEAAQPAPA